MNSLLHKVVGTSKEISRDIRCTPLWVQLGGYALLLVGPQLDPTISPEAQSHLGRATVLLGIAAVLKAADTHRERRYEKLLEERLMINRSRNSHKQASADGTATH